MIKPPGFWFKAGGPDDHHGLCHHGLCHHGLFNGGLVSNLLVPASWLYRLGSLCHARLHSPARRLPLPSVMVGNLVLGGAGKTPMVRSLADYFVQSGLEPHILTRGFGGTIQGPHHVDPERDLPERVGDEPLMLAHDHSVWVGADRHQSAHAAKRAAKQANHAVLILDDGVQNPRLSCDLTFVVIDGKTGFGNGRLVPAGPLREPPESRLRAIDGVVVIGEASSRLNATLSQWMAEDQIIRARQILVAADALRNQRLVAFAGIGRPEKFRDSLLDAGLDLVHFVPFGDHHRYHERELAALARQAHEAGAKLVTTEKDMARLIGTGWAEAFDIQPVHSALQFDDGAQARLDALLGRMRHAQITGA